MRVPPPRRERGPSRIPPRRMPPPLARAPQLEPDRPRPGEDRRATPTRPAAGAPAIWRGAASFRSRLLREGRRACRSAGRLDRGRTAGRTALDAYSDRSRPCPCSRRLASGCSHPATASASRKLGRGTEPHGGTRTKKARRWGAPSNYPDDAAELRICSSRPCGWYAHRASRWWRCRRPRAGSCRNRGTGTRPWWSSCARRHTPRRHRPRSPT